MLISYSILCLHIICVIHVTNIKLYSQTVSFSIVGHMPRKSPAVKLIYFIIYEYVFNSI